MFLSYLVFSFVFGQIVQAQELISNCPDFFKYDNSRVVDGRWFGEIILNSEFNLAGYWVELELSNTAEVFGLRSNQHLTTKDNKNYIFVARTDKIEPGKPSKIPIFVKYDLLSLPVPEVISIHVNGREVCPMQSPTPVGISPCPAIFTYDPDQPEASGKWFGSITLNLEYNLRGIFLEFHLNGKADLVGGINYRVKHSNNQEINYWNFIGDITTKDNRIYTITNSSFVLTHGHILTIPFFVKYDILSGIPLVNTVVVNGRVICQGSFNDLQPQIPLVFDTTNLASFPSRTQSTEKPAASLFSSISSTTPLIIPDIPDFFDDEEDDGLSNEGYQCGVQEISDKIIRGSTTTIGKHPWHGVIFREEKYSCGMTLISRKHAISAAHCFFEHSRFMANHTSLVFRFGIDNLNDRNSRDAQTGRLSQIYVHPKYHYHTPKFDIAVVGFTNQLRITESVIPVCLWSGDVSQHQIENKTGVIVGFGQTENGEYSNILREARILVVDLETCRATAALFYASLLSINSFCAGNISTEIGSCAGDSGGGFFFKRPASEIWEIRGITSSSRNKDLSCDTQIYTIYTDVARFKDWILQIMQN